MAIINTFRFITSHPLTANDKVGALSRFFKWQIGNRFYPYPIVYPFVAGTSLVIERGMTGATGNLYTGLHEFSDMGFLLHFLRDEDLFVDIGANIGSYTILASGVCKSQSVAIEPSSTTFQHLIRNIRLNRLDAKVKALNIGLGAERSILHFTKSFDTINHIATPSEITKDTEEVVIESLDTVIGHVQHPLLLKIDVEGFEAEVLRGAPSTLYNEKLKAIIIELNGSGERYGFKDADIHSKLTEAGFFPYSYSPLGRLLKELPNFQNGNTLYLRDIEFIKARINNSPLVTVLGHSF